MRTAEGPICGGNVLKLSEAALLVRVSASTARALAQMGRFPGAFKIGNVWRVNGDVLAVAMAGTGAGCIGADLSSVKE